MLLEHLAARGATVVPEPDEAKEYLPGLAFTSAISSGTVFAGSRRPHHQHVRQLPQHGDRR